MIARAVGTKAKPKACQQSPESLDKSRFYLSLDPPKSPLRKGDARVFLVPPLYSPLGGGRGGLGARGVEGPHSQTTVSDWV